jgi:hypothetical protein
MGLPFKQNQPELYSVNYSDEIFARVTACFSAYYADISRTVRDGGLKFFSQMYFHGPNTYTKFHQYSISPVGVRFLRGGPP